MQPVTIVSSAQPSAVVSVLTAMPPLWKPLRLRRTPAGPWQRAVRRLGQLAVAGCAACMVSSGFAQAGVRELPAPPRVDIERSTLNAASPQVLGPANPAREKMLQTLRATAQGDRPLRTQRPSARSSTDIRPADAAWLLGLLSLHGLAVQPDPQQAQHWFERAQMLGHPLAPAGIAWCQISGCVTSPNPAAALHWVALLQRTDPGLARYLEWHAAKAMAPLADPPPQPIAPDQGAVQAAQPLRHLLVAAAGAGNPQALNELGLEDLAAGHIEPALGWFRAAAPRSAAAAANVRLLESRVQSSANAARPLARQSANDWFLQARKYHRGDGVPSNYAEAIRLYQIAASSGSAQARKMLGLIFSRPAPGGEVDIAWMQQLAALEVSASGASSGATAPWASYGWQRDPSPLYALVPPEWRSPEPPPRR